MWLGEVWTSMLLRPPTEKNLLCHGPLQIVVRVAETKGLTSDPSFGMMKIALPQRVEHCYYDVVSLLVIWRPCYYFHAGMAHAYCA